MGQLGLKFNKETFKGLGTTAFRWDGLTNVYPHPRMFTLPDF